MGKEFSPVEEEFFARGKKQPTSAETKFNPLQETSAKQSGVKTAEELENEMLGQKPANDTEVEEERLAA